ncbi:MAG: 2Fe-2S iron-sulfur cluster binding domain-containing protein [Planctomycetes bacterium]|nr:2Fe-2S iron-sulfur cluster binding domain-containing protein [Planctomycetota bacterium]
MPKVRFEPSGIEVEVPAGTSLMAAADQAARQHDGEFFKGECCEGRLECGNCCLEILEGMANLSPAGDEELALLKVVAPKASRQAWRASCAAEVNGDVVAKVPDR